MGRYNLEQKGIFPPSSKAVDAEDQAEFDRQERRLFQVAMSRAMRKLLVVYSPKDPSDFIADLDAGLWDWRTV